MPNEGIADSGRVARRSCRSPATNPMNDILALAAAEVRRFLEAHLPALGSEWWKQHIVDRLTFPQQRALTERGLKSLADLDLAALLRVLDQNWYELTQRATLPRDARSWVRELQTVRNKLVGLITKGRRFKSCPRNQMKSIDGHRERWPFSFGS